MTSRWSASPVRSSSPSRRTRRPTRAPASCTASRRRSFVSTVQWHWSSSSLAGGPPRTAFESSRTSGESSPGTTTPRPPQPAHEGRPILRLPPAKSSRPAAVSCVGRSSATTERLRSSPQTAATIGTGSSAARLMRRVETGSRRASVASTVRTPRSPSASPTAAATSRTMRRSSVKGSLDAADVRPLDVEALADRHQHEATVDVAAREEVDVGEPELGPGVDA